MTPDDQWIRGTIRAFEDDQRLRALAWQADERMHRLQLLADCSPDEAAMLIRQFSPAECARLNLSSASSRTPWISLTVSRWRS